jgi:hypothetical protein
MIQSIDALFKNNIEDQPQGIQTDFNFQGSWHVLFQQLLSPVVQESQNGNTAFPIEFEEWKNADVQISIQGSQESNPLLGANEKENNEMLFIVDDWNRHINGILEAYQFSMPKNWIEENSPELSSLVLNWIEDFSGCSLNQLENIDPESVSIDKFQKVSDSFHTQILQLIRSDFSIHDDWLTKRDVVETNHSLGLSISPSSHLGPTVPFDQLVKEVVGLFELMKPINKIMNGDSEILTDLSIDPFKGQDSEVFSSKLSENKHSIEFSMNEEDVDLSVSDNIYKLSPNENHNELFPNENNNDLIEHIKSSNLLEMKDPTLKSSFDSQPQNRKDLSPEQYKEELIYKYNSSVEFEPLRKVLQEKGVDFQKLNFVRAEFKSSIRTDFNSLSGKFDEHLTYSPKSPIESIQHKMENKEKFYFPPDQSFDDLNEESMFNGLDQGIDHIKIKNSMDENIAIDEVQKSFSSQYQREEGLSRLIFRQVDHHFQNMVQNGKQQLIIQLEPENLGKVELKIEMQKDQLSVFIKVESETIRQAIYQQLQQLRESLDLQNVNLEKAQVFVQNQEQKFSGSSSDDGSGKKARNKVFQKESSDLVSDLSQDATSVLYKGYNSSEWTA